MQQQAIQQRHSAPQSCLNPPSNGNPFKNQQASVAQTSQFAGHASAIHSHSTPVTDHSWLADTGATSHMTPHKHWFQTYTPFKTAITVADGRVIYSSGIGTVCFQPIVNGQKCRVLEFDRVLHVPELNRSLFAVLWLSVKKNIDIFISGCTLKFCRTESCLWTATVNNQYSAYLDGFVLTAPPSISSQTPILILLHPLFLSHPHHS
jgi:hypothetical protein